jgi:nicotinamide mononucleotide adenylyltransferase
MTWRTVRVDPNPGVLMGQVHVVPEQDLREHDAIPRCWCRPMQNIEHPPIWVHNALDGRESYEQGRALQ